MKTSARADYQLRPWISAALMLLALIHLRGAAAAAPRPLQPEDPQAPERKPVSFHGQVRPILQQHCQGCHQPAKAGGKLIVTSHDQLLKSGRGKTPIIVPGKPDESLLIQEITPEGGEASMPKDGEPLAAADIDLIRRWIIEGARDDSPESAKTVYSMEQPPVYRAPPVLPALAYSPDGSLLAVAGYHEILLHKTGGGLAARLVGSAERLEAVEFSPDGKYLAACGGTPALMGEVQIWNVEQRKLHVAVPLTFDSIFGASWSNDGRLVAFGCCDNSVRAIEAETGKQVLFQGAHNDWVLGTTFSKDSSHVISVSRDMSMKLIVVATQQFVDNITSITPGALKGGLIDVQRHPTEDQVLAAGADGEPKIYRIYREKARQIGDDFNLIRKFDKLPGRVYSTRFDKTGSRFVAGSSDDDKGEVRVYEVADGKLIWKLELNSAVYAVAYRPDGGEVAVGGFDGKVRLVDAASGTLLREFVPVPVSVDL
jgi:WD40 repeat protein